MYTRHAANISWNIWIVDSFYSFNLSKGNTLFEQIRLLELIFLTVPILATNVTKCIRIVRQRYVTISFRYINTNKNK